MSFQDELNKKSKTQQEIDEELRKSMDVSANLEYYKIKDHMLLRAERGDFVTRGNKKYITLYHELHSYNLDNLVKEEDVQVKHSYGFLNLQTKTIIKKRIVVNNSRSKEFKYFMDSIRKYAAEDNITMEAVMYSKNENIEYTIPTPIIGIYIVGYKFCLKCTIEY